MRQKVRSEIVLPANNLDADINNKRESGTTADGSLKRLLGPRRFIARDLSSTMPQLNVVRIDNGGRDPRADGTQGGLMKS